MKVKYRGFTLIELLVVIAIIAVLVSVVLPSLKAVKAQARAVVCKSNLKAIGLCFMAYLPGNKDKFPSGFSDNQKDSFWMTYLRPYYADSRVFCCPTAKIKNSDPVFTIWGPFDGAYWTTKDDYGSYGMNAWLDNPDQSSSPVIGDHRDYWRGKLVTTNANRVPLVLDSYWIGGWPRYYDSAPQFNGDQSRDTNRTEHMSRFSISRHPRVTTNATFLDGSVNKLSLPSLWEDCLWSKTWIEEQSQTPKPVFPDWMKQ